MQKIIDARITEICAEVEASIPTIPNDLEKNYAKAGGWGGLAAGALGGAKLGAGLGIAGGPAVQLLEQFQD